MNAFELNKIAGAALAALLLIFGGRTLLEIVDKPRHVEKAGYTLPMPKGGPNRTGPNLYGVVDRDVGKHEGFNYSPALKDKGGKWDWAHLAAYLHNPRQAIPNNRMAFPGVSDNAELADLLAYLRTLSDSPAALPK